MSSKMRRLAKHIKYLPYHTTHSTWHSTNVSLQLLACNKTLQTYIMCWIEVQAKSSAILVLKPIHTVGLKFMQSYCAHFHIFDISSVLVQVSSIGLHGVIRCSSPSFVKCQVLCVMCYGKYLICCASLRIFEDIFPRLLNVVLTPPTLHIALWT